MTIIRLFRLGLAKRNVERAKQENYSAITNAKPDDPLASDDLLQYLRAEVGPENYKPHELWGEDADGQPLRPTLRVANAVLANFNARFTYGMIEGGYL